MEEPKLYRRLTLENTTLRQKDSEIFSFPDLARFHRDQPINFRPLSPVYRPFDSLPNEILHQILSHVAVDNSCLEHDVLSKHIYTARLLQRRITRLVDYILTGKNVFGAFHQKAVPMTKRELVNFVGAGSNEIFCGLLTELYLPVVIQTTGQREAMAWDRLWAAKPTRPRHTGWAYCMKPYPEYANRLHHRQMTVETISKTDMHHFNIFGSALRNFRNLRSLKVHTIAPPLMKFWDGTYSPIVADARFWRGDNYTALVRLFDILSAAKVPIKVLDITGLAPALLEDQFAQHLPTWSLLHGITTLKLSLLDTEDYSVCPAEVLIAFLSQLYALQHLELHGQTLDRSRTSEYSVELLIEILAVRPRAYLRTLKLRTVSCYGWALRKLLDEHPITLRHVHLDDVSLLDEEWYKLVSMMRNRTRLGMPWEKVVLRMSKDRWADGLDAFHDADSSALMQEIVAKFGDGEGYNTARMEISRYVTDVREEKTRAESEESDDERGENGRGDDEDEDEEKEKAVFFDPDYA